MTFPTSSTALFTGQYYLYFSPDGNFVFGGSPTGFDMFVGRAYGQRYAQLEWPLLRGGPGSGYFHLKLRLRHSRYFYGAFNANGGNIVAHQRLINQLQPLRPRLHLQRHI